LSTSVRPTSSARPNTQGSNSFQGLTVAQKKTQREVTNVLRRKVEQRLSEQRRTTVKGKPIKQRRFKSDLIKALLRFLNSGWFDLCSVTLIVSFSLYIMFPLASEAQCNSNRGGNLVVDIVFCLLFLLELLLRIAPYGLSFFTSSEWVWNLADSVIVCLTCVQVAIEIATQDASVVNPVAFRMLRLLRAMSTFRVARVFTRFRELRLLVYSVLGCMRSLGFSLLMLWSFILLCSTILTVGAQSCDYSSTTDQSSELLKFFGTLGRTCMTLYMAICGGMDWGENYWTLEPIGWQYQATYILYVSFAIFGLVNVFAGVFVEHAMQAGSKDRELQIRNQIDQDFHNLKQLQRVFEELDVNNSGKLSLDEFENHLSDERAMAYFSAVKLDVSEVPRLFRLMDTDNSGSVDIEEFIVGCERLKGESRSLDIKVALLEIEHVKESIEKLSGQVSGLLTQMTL